MSNAGVTDFQLAPTEDKHGFSEALSAAKQSNLNGAAVDSKTPEELQDAVTFISPDGMAGGAVEPNGNVTAVFKNANSSGRKAGIDIAFAAIAHGGDRLDCYGPFLVNTYAQAGMEPVARIKYTWGINPEMDAQVQRQISEGDIPAPPDIYFMKRMPGVSLKQAASDYAAGNGKRYSLEELNALPLFEGENAYDEALAYRDSLIQNTGNAEQRLPGLGDDLSGTAINPSVSAAGRGFSWGGEGVAGQEVPSQSNLIAYPSDEKVAAVYKQFGGTVAQTWMKYKMQVDTNGNDSISQAEAKVWLSHSNLSQAQKAWFWQNTNKRWEKRSNPFI